MRSKLILNEATDVKMQPTVSFYDGYLLRRKAVDMCRYRGENNVQTCARFLRDNFVKSDGKSNEKRRAPGAATHDRLSVP